MAILHQCLDDKQYNKLQLLIQLGHDPNEQDIDGKNLLMKAIVKIFESDIRLRIIETLIAAGISVNTQDEDGKTALMCACRRGFMTEVEILLKNHADINLCNKKGQSALFYACDHDYLDIAVYLLAQGANPDICELKYGLFGGRHNYSLDDVVFWTAKWLNSAWLFLCLQNMVVDINITDKNGESLLFYALHNYNSVCMLLKSGINVNIRNQNGQTVLTHAKKTYGHSDLVRLLKEHGAIE